MQMKYFGSALPCQKGLDAIAALRLSALVASLAVAGGCTMQPPTSVGTQVLRVGAQNTAETEQVLVEKLSAEPLLVLDAHGRAAPRLASDWKWLDDGRALSMTLMPGVRFHDGTPLTAPTVAALLRKNIPVDRSEGFRYLTSIDTPDAQTVIFRLSRVDSFLFDAIASALVLDDDKPNLRTGPFKIVSRRSGIQAERNTSYYRGSPGIDRVEVTLYDTQRAVFAAMMKGSLDMVPEVNPQSVEFLEGASQFETFASVRPFYIPFVFNLRHPILKHVEVRRAIVHAIDREEIVRQAMRGHAKIADDPVWPSHWAYNSGAKSYAYDPAAARLELDAAGFPVRPTMTPGRMASRFQLHCLFYNKDFQFERIAILLQRQLEEVGIDLVLSGADEATLTRRAHDGNFDSYVFQLTSGKSFDWTYRFWHSDSGFQSTGYTGANLALDQLRNSHLDGDVRVAVANLRQRFYEDVPAAFLAWPETTRAIDTRFDLGDHTDPDVFANLWRWRAAADLRVER
jgi:peptide/nickel transport system substrate-binding protein